MQRDPVYRLRSAPASRASSTPRQLAEGDEARSSSTSRGGKGSWHTTPRPHTLERRRFHSHSSATTPLNRSPCHSHSNLAWDEDRPKKNETFTAVNNERLKKDKGVRASGTARSRKDETFITREREKLRKDETFTATSALKKDNTFNLTSTQKSENLTSTRKPKSLLLSSGSSGGREVDEMLLSHRDDMLRYNSLPRTSRAARRKLRLPSFQGNETFSLSSTGQHASGEEGKEQNKPPLETLENDLMALMEQIAEHHRRADASSRPDEPPTYEETIQQQSLAKTLPARLRSAPGSLSGSRRASRDLCPSENHIQKMLTPSNK